MTDSNKKLYIWTMLITTILVYGLLFCITQDTQNIQITGLLKILPTTVTIEFFLVIVFIKWLWKWKFLHPWFVIIPNLSGRWEGIMHYKYNEQDEDRKTQVEILQSFNHISILLSTCESDSHTVASAFDIDKNRGIYDLYYTYVNEPHIDIQDKNAIHYGTTRLHFDAKNNNSLCGEYWTSRNTKGTIHLCKVQ